MTGDDDKHFVMDSNTGIIKVEKILDREMVMLYSQKLFNNVIIIFKITLVLLLLLVILLF